MSWFDVWMFVILILCFASFAWFSIDQYKKQHKDKTDKKLKVVSIKVTNLEEKTTRYLTEDEINELYPDGIIGKVSREYGIE
jgi:hypothetical protein